MERVAERPSRGRVGRRPAGNGRSPARSSRPPGAGAGCGEAGSRGGRAWRGQPGLPRGAAAAGGWQIRGAVAATRDRRCTGIASGRPRWPASWTETRCKLPSRGAGQELQPAQPSMNGAALEPAEPRGRRASGGAPEQRWRRRSRQGPQGAELEPAWASGRAHAMPGQGGGAVCSGVGGVGGSAAVAGRGGGASTTQGTEQRAGALTQCSSSTGVAERRLAWWGWLVLEQHAGLASRTTAVAAGGGDAHMRKQQRRRGSQSVCHVRARTRNI